MLRRGRGGVPPGLDPRRAVGPALVVAVVAAPLLGLLYGRVFGLAILAAALTMTIAVAIRSAPAVPPEHRRRLRVLIGVNVATLILAAVVALLVVR